MARSLRYLYFYYGFTQAGSLSWVVLNLFTRYPTTQIPHQKMLNMIRQRLTLNSILKPFFFSVIALLCACDGTSTAPTTQKTATQYSDYNGKMGDLTQPNGKWLVINYWAKWCNPCIKEIPELNHFSQKLTNKVDVFAVNYDGVTGTELQQQAEAIGIAFIILEQDPSKALELKRPNILPTTYIINPNGQLHKTLHGPQTLESLVNSLQ